MNPLEDSAKNYETLMALKNLCAEDIPTWWDDKKITGRLYMTKYRE